MQSIKYYLANPYKDGVTKEDIKELKRAGKSTGKYLNDKPTIVYLFLTFPGRRLIRLNTHEKVRGIYWDHDKNCVKPNMHGSLELNDRLNYLKAEVTRQYRKMITNSPNTTLAQVKKMAENVLSGTIPDFNRKTFLECFAEFIKEHEVKLDEKTIIKYNTVVTLITTWMSQNGLKPNDFYCEQVDMDFEFSWRNYLVTERQVVENTISKYTSCIKTVMRWSRKKNYHSTIAFEDFSTKKTRSEIIWISDEEMTQLINYQPEDKIVRRTKLVFLFMLYTAQRYGDYKEMRRRHLVINSDGTVDWKLFQRKGIKTLETLIPIIEPALEILDLFGFREMEPDEYVIPITSNQHFNRAIKKFCKDAGLNSPLTIIKVVGTRRIELNYEKWEKISCHTSRKSWVSLSMEKGLNSEYLASVTGHQSEKVLRQHYLGLNQGSKRKAIEAAWKSMDEKKDAEMEESVNRNDNV